MGLVTLGSMSTTTLYSLCRPKEYAELVGAETPHPTAPPCPHSFIISTCTFVGSRLKLYLSSSKVNQVQMQKSKAGLNQDDTRNKPGLNFVTPPRLFVDSRFGAIFIQQHKLVRSTKHQFRKLKQD